MSSTKIPKAPKITGKFSILPDNDVNSKLTGLFMSPATLPPLSLPPTALTQKNQAGNIENKKIFRSLLHGELSSDSK